MIESWFNTFRPGRGTASYYLEDASDSIAAMVNGSGAKTADYRYDGFGRLRPGSDAPADLGFHAAWLDPATGLYDMRARSYDPATGRFTTPDPVEPSPQAPETYNPYTFADNNPHLYSDPTGGFSVTEINVGNAIQAVIRNVRTVAIKEAKDYAKQRVQSFVGDMIADTLTAYIPGGQFRQMLEDRVKGRPLGTEFELDVRKALHSFKDAPLAKNIWLAPRVHITGRPATNGINVGGVIGGGTNLRQTTAYAVPDFLMKPEGTWPLDEDTKGWVIGDFKLSVNALYNDYFKDGGDIKKRNQWKSISNYARRQQNVPVTLFFTYHPGTQDVAKKIAKEAFMTGAAMVIVSLRK